MGTKQSIYTGVLTEPSPFIIKGGWGSGMSAVIITKMQQHIDQCMAALLRHYNIRPEEMDSAAPWKLLIAVAKEHVLALATPQGSMKEVGDGNRKISELCVLIWYINQLKHTENYGEILDALQEGKIPKEIKLVPYYDAAKLLIPPVGPKGRPAKGEVRNSVTTRGSEEKGTKQDIWYDCWRDLKEAEKSGADRLAAFIDERRSKLVSPMVLLKAWFNELIETASDRLEWIEWEYDGRVEEPPFVSWCVYDPNIELVANTNDKYSSFGTIEEQFDPLNREERKKDRERHLKPSEALLSCGD